jgi:serine/threonine-protein kinase
VDLRSQLQSTLGDTYTIERELGGGGMSRVFVATERALGRKVVIKVLPSEAAGAVSIDRFKQEIALAARLQQANIVPVLSAGDFGGVPYFTMPYVEGESLRARLSSGGELPIADAVGILKEVARALAYAHDHGVVHRDIKPDNVLLSGGTAMVTDFGVAKAVSAATTADGSALTATGITVGTPAYMAPEQASADPKVDHRADIYSFGCLAYELLTGAAPFAGRSPQAMIKAHLTEDPDPVERRRTTVSWPLAALVARCLAKNPADRPQSASELTQALDQAISAPTTAASPKAGATVRRRGPMLVAAAVIIVVGAALLTVPIARRFKPTVRSIAVMPIKNATRDTAYDYLADGFTDEIHTELTKVPGLTVTGQQSANTFKDKTADLNEIATKLHVANLVQGSLTFGGGRLHLAIDVVRASDGASLWSKTYDSDLKDFYAVRDSVAGATAKALALTLGTTPRERRMISPAALELVLRGRFASAKSGKADLDEAIRLFSAALQVDPNAAEAYAGIAWAHTFLADVYASPVVAYTDAERAAKKALAIDSTIADAHLVLGMTHMFRDWNFDEADREYAIAARLNPQRAEATSTRAVSLTMAGRTDEAVVEADRAVRIDPLSAIAGWQRAYCLYMAGRYREVLAANADVHAIDPNFFYGWSWGARAYRALGDKDSAFAEVQADIRRAPPGTLVADLATTLAWMGRADAARAAIRQQESQYRASYAPELSIVVGYAALGDADQAFAWLDKVFETRSVLWTGLVHIPEWKPMMADPRWATFLKRAEAAKR